MNDEKKTKKQLIDELNELREQVAILQKGENRVVDNKITISGQYDSETLQQERILLRTLMENVPDHIYFKDADSRFVMISNSQAEIFHLNDPNLVIGKTDFDFFTEEHARSAFETEKKIMQTGQPIVGIEEKETWPDRPDSWVSTTKLPLRDEKGNIVGTFGISRDITRQKLAEQAARETELKFQKYIEYSPIGIFVVDEFGHYLDCNTAAHVMIGYSREELLESSIVDLTPHDEIEWSRRNFAIVRETGHLRLETNLLCKNKSIIPVILEAVRLPNNMFMAYCIDISERKQQEAVIQESEARYRALFNHAGDYVILMDITDGKIPVIVDANEIALTAHGYSREEFIGMPINILDPHLSPEIVAKRVKTMDTGESLLFEARHVRRDGSTFDVEVKSTLVRLSDINLIVTVERDITERKKVEAALRMSEARFSSIFHLSPLAIALTQTDGNILIDVNEAWQSLTGYSRDEAVGHNPIDLNAWTNPDERDRLVKALTAQSSVHNFEMQMIQKSGAIRDLLMSAEQINVAGEQYMLSVALDMTDRKQMELDQKKLLDNLQSLWFLATRQNMDIKNLADHVLNEIIRFSDSEFSFYGFLNDDESVLRIYSWSSEAMKQCNVDDKPFDYVIADAGCWAEAVRIRKPIIVNDYQQDHAGKLGLPTGHVTIHRFVTIPVTVGNKIVAVAAVANKKTDYTNADVQLLEGFLYNAQILADRKQADEALQKSNALLNSTGRIAKVGGWELDAEIQNIVWSDEIYHIHDVALDYKPTPESCNQFFTPEHQIIAKENIERVLKFGESFDVELQIVTAMGNNKWLHVVGEPRRENNSIVSIIGAMQDITESKLTDQSYKEALAFSEMILETSPVGILIFREDGPCVMTNAAAETISGGCREKLLQLNFRELESYRKKGLTKLMLQALESGEILRKEVHAINTYGAEVWYEGSFSSFNLNGKKHLIFIISDIKDRKLAEKALRESEERWQFALEGSGDGVWDWNVQTNKVFYSHQWKTMLGFDDNEIGDMLAEWENLVHPDDIETVYSEIHKHFAGKTPIYMNEHRIRCKDGSYKWILDRGKVIERTADGQPVRIIGTHTDYTERKRLEREIRNQRDFAENLIETAQVIILVLDTQGRIVRFNPYFEQLSGYSLDEVKGKDWFTTFISPKDNEALHSLFSNAMNDNNTHGNINPITTKDGQEVSVEWYDKTLKDSDNATIGLLAVGQNITDRIRIESEKQKLEEQLRRSQKQEAIGTLAGGIAHDFNNILTPILGYTDMVLTTLPSSSPIRDDLENVLRGANRAKELVKQILAFSRQIELERKPLKLQFIIKETIEFLRSSIPTTIRIQHNIDTTCESVIADPSQMHQVIVNLCINAAHAMEEKGGVLRIELNQVLVTRALTKLYPNLSERKYLRLTVADTGIGMSKATLERIFEPFFTTKAVDKGTGLGLSVVHGIIRNHGGDIIVDSELGKGSTFQIYLPIEEQEKTAVDEPIVSIKGGQETILVVDDEDVISNLLKKALQRLGYQVTACNKSMDAFELLKKKSKTFDLVISDLTMPNMTGLELAKKMREIRLNMPIILITGYGENVTTDTLEHYGISKIIGKPIVINKLAHAVREVLDV
ncbi:PAS domain S-box protein [candidate division KSB1 bacterium]|nr:PAS domain S-box protein [candidate division KSB1 bacterium]